MVLQVEGSIPGARIFCDRRPIATDRHSGRSQDFLRKKTGMIFPNAQTACISTFEQPYSGFGHCLY
jgi:hypothetical protein